MRIILVDHDKKSLTWLEGIIRHINPKDSVLCFNDSIEALEYIEQQMVHEVFVEVNMQRMTGLMLTRKIKEVSKHIKVIVMASDEAYAMEAWNVHADYFLKKPIQLMDIIKMRE